MPEGISWLQLFWNDVGVQNVERWWKKICVIIVENTPDQNWWISGQTYLYYSQKIFFCITVNPS